MADRLVPIYEANSMTEATLYQAMLREAGMESMCRPTGNPVVSSIIYYLPPIPYQLLVLQRDIADAHDLVTAFAQDAQQRTLQLTEAELQGDVFSTEVSLAAAARFMAACRRIGHGWMVIWLITALLQIAAIIAGDVVQLLARLSRSS
ncbi:MAG TPA: hypothetical protein VGL77_17115 [Armatimonadota bacterium]|jgi:hypothetical protein